MWTPTHNASFRALIHAFITAPVLALPDHSKPFRLITDASDFATGAILEQPDALNHWHPVAYHSKSLQPVERNYEIHNKELFAIVCTLDIFHHYLEGQDDTVEVRQPCLLHHKTEVHPSSGLLGLIPVLLPVYHRP